jgi:Flp pilus assembly protein TadG
MSKAIQSVAMAARALQRDERGGVAVIFALAIIPVAFLSLVMLDYSRASTAKQGLQENLDAATLIAARSSAIEPDAVDKIGEEAFMAQLPSNAGIAGLTPDKNGRLTGLTFTPNGNTISGAVDATYTPMIAGMFLKSASNPTGGIKIAARSEVVRSMGRLEIAMVLDTTGSMQGSKIDNLKEAAKNFVTTMEAAHKRSVLPPSTPAVRIAVVPFSTTVKVLAPMSAASYTSATSRGGIPTWLDGTASAFPLADDIFSGSSRTDRFKLLRQMGVKWGGCVEARKAPYDIQDTAPTTSNASTLFTPFFWPDEPDTSSAFKNDYLSDGTSSTDWKTRERRPQKYTASPANGTFSQGYGYGAAGVLGPNAGCAMQQLQRLTTDFSSLRDAIDDLVPSGETNIPLGLMWGWHAISPNAPLADGSAYNTENLTKVIVLMTDGDNTMNDSGNSNDSWYHGYGYIWQNRLGTTSSDANVRSGKLDDRLKSLCANIRNANIIVYAVGVGVSTNAKGMLQDCAKNAGGLYYDVNSTGSNLDAAFSAIAGSIENLRISK